MRCVTCLSRDMRPEIGRSLVEGEEQTLLWWRCAQGHIGTAVALPDALASFAWSTILGSGESWSERPTSPASGVSYRATASASSPSCSDDWPVPAGADITDTT